MQEGCTLCDVSLTSEEGEGVWGKSELYADNYEAGFQPRMPGWKEREVRLFGLCRLSQMPVLTPTGAQLARRTWFSRYWADTLLDSDLFMKIDCSPHTCCISIRLSAQFS